MTHSRHANSAATSCGSYIHAAPWPCLRLHGGARKYEPWASNYLDLVSCSVSHLTTHSCTYKVLSVHPCNLLLYCSRARHGHALFPQCQGHERAPTILAPDHFSRPSAMQQCSSHVQYVRFRYVHQHPGATAAAFYHTTTQHPLTDSNLSSNTAYLRCLQGQALTTLIRRVFRCLQGQALTTLIRRVFPSFRNKLGLHTRQSDTRRQRSTTRQRSKIQDSNAGAATGQYSRQGSTASTLAARGTHWKAREALRRQRS